MKKSEALVRWVLARGVWLWALALLAFLPAAVHTARLYAGLRSEFDRLLPSNAPSVVALNELRGRLEGLQHLGVVVEADDASKLPAAEHFIDDLKARVESYPPGLVRTVRTGQQEERAFLESHAALYVDLADLRTARERIEARRDWEVAKATGTNLDDEPPPPVVFDDIKQKYEQKGSGQRFANGRFTSAEHRTSLLLIEVGSEHNAGRQLLERVKADMAALGGPAKYAPGLRAGFSGEVAISVEETEALMADLSVSSLLVLLAVTIVLQGYFRWRMATPVLLAPLLIATAISFALAGLPPFNVRELNSNTAFLASIIIGNGINPGIILLARYLEERRHGRDPRAALIEAVPASAPGTIVAALAAASSYAALALTQFQGFRQFGFLGGLGMVCAWTMTYLLLPPLLLWVDRRGEALPSAGGASFLDPLARMIGKRAPIIAVVGGVLTLAAIVPVRHFGLDNVETDFSRLRRADTWKNGEGYWGGKMNAMLGEYLTPLVALTDSPEAAKQAAVGVRKLATDSSYANLVAKVRTIDDVMPAQQAEKLEEARLIRAALTPRIRSHMTDEQKKQVERFIGQADLQPLTLEQLPRSFTTGLRERDGHVDRTVLIFPRPSRDVWQGPRLLGFVTALRQAVSEKTPDPSAPRLAGGLPVSADIVSSVEHDGPLVTLAAFVGAVVVVLALFRMRAATWQVLGALLLGVLWMTGLALGAGVKINFCNFIAFPITFGIGVEYAANVLNRYEVEGKRDILAAVRSTGAAVAVCSSTTIIGYSSLLVADNRALFLFGLLAVLGEFTCIVAALVVLPALMRLGRPPAESSDVPSGAGVAP